MSARITAPMPAPTLNIYDPSGQPIIHHHPEVSGTTTTTTIINKEGKQEQEIPPMFKCGDRLSILSGDHFYHLPKEMEYTHWEGDLGDLYNFKQLPYGNGDWPSRVSSTSSHNDDGLMGQIPVEYLDDAAAPVVQEDVDVSLPSSDLSELISRRPTMAILSLWRYSRSATQSILLGKAHSQRSPRSMMRTRMERR